MHSQLFSHLNTMHLLGIISYGIFYLFVCKLVFHFEDVLKQTLFDGCQFEKKKSPLREYRHLGKSKWTKIKKEKETLPFLFLCKSGLKHNKDSVLYNKLTK